MSPRTLIVTLVGVGCIGAAGLGGYLAVRAGSAAPEAAPAVQGAPTPLQPEPSTPAAAPPADAGPAPAAPVRVETPRVRRPEPRPAPARVASAEPAPARRAQPSAAGAIDTVEPAAPVVRPVDGLDAIPETIAAGEAAETSATDPARPAALDITVPENSVIGIRFESAISTETARVEDRVSARVTRDVTVDGRTAIPAGATLEGAVSLVQAGGSFKDRSRIGVQFTTMVLPDKTRVPIRTEAIYRDGEAPGGEATSKIGASAVVGAVLGAVFGGKKGAAIGGTAGAAGGTAMVVAGGPNHATIPAGTPLTVRLIAPVSVSVPLPERADP